jgi:hypothetical protein
MVEAPALTRLGRTEEGEANVDLAFEDSSQPLALGIVGNARGSRRSKRRPGWLRA